MLSVGKKTACVSETRMVVCCGLIFIESTHLGGHLLNGGQAARATCLKNYSVNVHPFRFSVSFITTQWAAETKLMKLKWYAFCLPAFDVLVVMTDSCGFSLNLHPSPSISIPMVNICCMNRLHTCTTDCLPLNLRVWIPERGEDFLGCLCCVFDTRQTEEVFVPLNKMRKHLVAWLVFLSSRNFSLNMVETRDQAPLAWGSFLPTTYKRGL